MANDIVLACQWCGQLNRIDAARYADRPKCHQCNKPFLLDRPVKVKDEDFDRTVLGSDIPVLVDFYADWYGPCKMMQPLLDNLASELAGRVLVVKVDTDASPTVSQRYGIKSIPLFGRFENGQLSGTAVGAQSLDALRQFALGADAPTPQ